MILRIILITGLVLPVLGQAAPLRDRESKKTFGIYNHGLKVGMGAVTAQSNQSLTYQSGLAFTTGLYSSFGWRARIQIQPEINVLARNTSGRDQVMLGASPTGLFRDTNYEIAEAQFGALLKLGRPRWSDEPEGHWPRDRWVQRERRWMPYIAAGAMANRLIEGKRVIQLDSPGSLPLTQDWTDGSRWTLEWVAAVGYEYMRARGGGIAVEARWQIRDLPVETGLGDSFKLSTFTANLAVLF